MVRIDAFKEELPLCVSILNDAIEKLNSEIVDSSKMNEELTRKEFMYMNDENLKDGEGISKSTIDDDDRKNWMLDVKLWNAQNPKSDNEIHVVSDLDSDHSWKTTIELGKEDQGLYILTDTIPFASSSTAVFALSDTTALDIPDASPYTTSTIQNASTSTVVSGQQDLHFNAQVQSVDTWHARLATPKRIKERMKISDLTIDEIKSHLQKYKNHCRLGGASTSTVPLSHTVQLSQTNSKITEGPSANYSGCGGADKEGD
ncbi:hypothetical protein POM88_050153 [Heracleum sosnowskyi]|uniref:HHO5-like N-terminal domain-containing protein n=1 Tax=Heracleum sosnowskyi TaxID=360622 RepID=A0AAD8M2A0_9APIA|nr:hypothetical protein POM88_050153 [Heracleum sosnowskyi]